MYNLRWQQRYQNFAKAFLELESALAQKTLNPIEKAGLIKIFEFTFELAWKVMKDKLNYEGFTVLVPREVIKQAFQVGYIKSPEIWLDALDKRNLMAHTYDREKADFALDLIKNHYFSLFKELHQLLQAELKE